MGFFRLGPRLNDSRLLAVDTPWAASVRQLAPVEPIRIDELSFTAHRTRPSIAELRSSKMFLFCKTLIHTSLNEAPAALPALIALLDERGTRSNSFNTEVPDFARVQAEFDQTIAAQVAGRILRLRPMESLTILSPLYGTCTEDGKVVILKSCINGRVVPELLLPLIVAELGDFFPRGSHERCDVLKLAGSRAQHLFGALFAVARDVTTVATRLDATGMPTESSHSVSISYCEMDMLDALRAIAPSPSSLDPTPFAAALQSASAHERLFALRAIKNLGLWHPTLVPEVVRCFDDSSAQVRFASYRALEGLASAFAKTSRSFKQRAFRKPMAASTGIIHAIPLLMSHAQEHSAPASLLLALAQIHPDPNEIVPLLRKKWFVLRDTFSETFAEAPSPTAPVSRTDSEISTLSSLGGEISFDRLGALAELPELVQAVTLLKRRSREARRLLRNMKAHPSALVSRLFDDLVE